MSNCNACGVLERRITDYAKMTEGLFLIWKKENPDKAYVAPSELVQWVLDEIEKHKVKSSIYGAALKGEQARTEETMDEYDRFEMSNWALSEQCKRMLEEIDYLNKLIYLTQIDVGDLLKLLSHDVERCTECDRFHAKADKCIE
jgi:hypothetical protein